MRTTAQYGGCDDTREVPRKLEYKHSLLICRTWEMARLILYRFLMIRMKRRVRVHMEPKNIQWGRLETKSSRIQRPWNGGKEVNGAGAGAGAADFDSLQLTEWFNGKPPINLYEH